MKVLIVDDSMVIRRVIANALKEMDVTETEEAKDGNEAVAAVQNADYDLVLMDWNMPNMLGIDAVKKIREMGKTVPIIMVTTEAEKSRVVEAIKTGANNYVIKPFEPSTLNEKIRQTMDKAGK